MLPTEQGMNTIHNLYYVNHTLTGPASPAAEWFCGRNGKQDVPGLILGHAFRPSRSAFSVVFSEIRVNIP